MPSRWGGGLVGVLVGSGVMYRGENECCCCCRREDFFALSWNREQRAKRVDHPLFAMYTYRERKSVVDREGLKQKNSTSFLLIGSSGGPTARQQRRRWVGRARSMGGARADYPDRHWGGGLPRVQRPRGREGQRTDGGRLVRASLSL